MSSKKSFRAFIDKVKKEFFTEEGDVVWRKFVDDVVPAALFGDSGCNGYNTNILKEIVCNPSYASEFRIRALLVMGIPDRSLLPVYWPGEKSFFVDMSNMIPYACLGVLDDFILEMFAHCITFVASEGTQDPCARQSRINKYMMKYFWFQDIEQLIMRASKDTAQRALDALATVPIISSFDNSSLHPLTNLFKGSLDKDLLCYLDGRIRRVVRISVRRCTHEQRECDIFEDYVFLVKCFIASAHESRDVQDLTSTQISFILRMWKEYGVSPKHPFHSLTSHCVRKLFSILHGESFSCMRRDITHYIMETSPELLYVGKNIINDPVAIRGTRLMLESLSPEDEQAAKRITTLLDTIEKQELSILRNRQEQNAKDKKAKDAYAEASRPVLVSMRQSIS